MSWLGTSPSVSWSTRKEFFEQKALKQVSIAIELQKNRRFFYCKPSNKKVYSPIFATNKSFQLLDPLVQKSGFWALFCKPDKVSFR